MKGLLTKEFYMLITSSMVLFIPVFILLGLLTKNSFFLTYIGVLFAMMPISLMTFDETSHWESYVLGLPFDRRRIVSSKYIMTLILTVGAAAIMLLMSYVFNKMGAVSYDEALPVAALHHLSGAALSAEFQARNGKGTHGDACCGRPADSRIHRAQHIESDDRKPDRQA